MTQKRSVRVAGEIQRELSRLIARDVKDPRVTGVVVTRVELTDDLHIGRAHVRMLQGGEDERAAALKGLESATPMLRRSIARSLRLRTVPELHFHYDEGPDKQGRVEELLREIETERKR